MDHIMKEAYEGRGWYYICQCLKLAIDKGDMIGFRGWSAMEPIVTNTKEGMSWLNQTRKPRAVDKTLASVSKILTVRIARVLPLCGFPIANNIINAKRTSVLPHPKPHTSPCH